MMKRIGITGAAYMAALTLIIIALVIANPHSDNRTPDYSVPTYSGEDAQCMADNIFYEGVSEPELGKVLIAETVKVRTATPNRWGDSICETVYEKAQFSWTFLPAYQLYAFKTNPNNADDYSAIMENIDFYMSAPTPLGFEGVTNFIRCDTKSRDGWEKRAIPLGQVGDHCFYREK